VADFKTTLKALSQGDIELEAIRTNLKSMLEKHPQLAASLMEQLGEAYAEDLIDAPTYARLKQLVDEHGGADDVTQFGAGETELGTSADATQFSDDDDGSTIAAQARAALDATSFRPTARGRVRGRKQVQRGPGGQKPLGTPGPRQKSNRARC